jgi:hypothetical protein
LGCCPRGIWSRWRFLLSLLGSSIIWPRGSEVGDFLSWSKLSTYCKLLFRWWEAWLEMKCEISETLSIYNALCFIWSQIIIRIGTVSAAKGIIDMLS